MACTEPNWACKASAIIGLRPTYGDSLCSSRDRPCAQDGQSYDVHSASASRVETYRKITRFHGRSWQDSLDFQEFGFSYNVVEPADVAPADELFYKGQILPLQTDTRLHAVQALSSCCAGEELVEVVGHAGRPSSVRRDGEVRFNSCRIDAAMYDKAADSSASGSMRSLSFRSHCSGYWESGAEKDTTDTSSSSRDSNGSSQDSYFPNANCKSIHSNLKVKPSQSPWKSFFGGVRKVSRRQHILPQTSPVVAFSEDLGKHRPVADGSCVNTKVSLAPLMSDKDAAQERAGFKSKLATNQCISHGGLQGIPVLGSEGVHNGEFGCESSDWKDGVEDGDSTSKSGIKDRNTQKHTSRHGKEETRGTMKGVKFLRLGKESAKSKDLSKGVTVVACRDIEGQKQRRSAVKERWQGYARKLKPLYEVKKGLIGQFRMDECGKNACEVESGIVRRPAWQRRLSHQSSFFKNHKLSMEHGENDKGSSHASNNNVLMAMSSCPPSTRSSPNHSGVLAVVGAESKAKLNQSGGNPNQTASNAGSIKKVGSNECISMSTMHELHSAVQSAIAHCKESNRRCSLD